MSQPVSLARSTSVTKSGLFILSIHNLRHSHTSLKVPGFLSKTHKPWIALPTIELFDWNRRRSARHYYPQYQMLGFKLHQLSKQTLFWAYRYALVCEIPLSLLLDTKALCSPQTIWVCSACVLSSTFYLLVVYDILKCIKPRQITMHSPSGTSLSLSQSHLGQNLQSFCRFLLADHDSSTLSLFSTSQVHTWISGRGTHASWSVIVRSELRAEVPITWERDNKEKTEEDMSMHVRTAFRVLLNSHHSPGCGEILGGGTVLLWHHVIIRI